MAPKSVRAIKEVEVITDKKKIKLLQDSKRAEILSLLSKKAMTVKQLGVALGRNPGTVMHHLDRLKKAGFVPQQEVKTVRMELANYKRLRKLTEAWVELALRRAKEKQALRP